MTNVVFVLVDQLRADLAYHERFAFVQTPSLDRFRESAITFDGAFCAYPVCAPARATIVTGRYPAEHGVLTNRSLLPPDERTIGHHLSALGYQTIAMGKTHGQNPGFLRLAEPPFLESLGATGWGFFVGQSMAEPQAPPGPPIPLVGRFERDKEYQYDYLVAKQFCDFVDSRDRSRPFFAFVGLHAPHPPLIPPREFAARYDAAHQEIPPDHDDDGRPAIQAKAAAPWRSATSESRRAIIAAYFAMVTMVDECFGRILDAIDRAGIADDTVVFFLSDHGEQLGEHGIIGKWNMFYEGSLRIPLAIRLPGAGSGTRRQLVEQVDLVPTICGLLGVPSPGGSGRSLVPVLEDADATGRDAVSATLIEKRASDVDARPDGRYIRGQMIRTDRWKLALYTDGSGELYDLAADPGERRNRFDDPALDAVRHDLTSGIARHLLEFGRAPTLWGANMFPG